MTCTLTILEKKLPDLDVEGSEYSEYWISQNGIRGTKKVSIDETVIELGAKPSGLPWVTIEIYSTEPIPGREYKAKQHLGSAILSLKDGIYTVPLFDPSVRDRLSNEYVELGSLTVQVDMCFTFPEYVKELDKVKDEIFEKAKEEQEHTVQEWIRVFMPRIIHQGVAMFYLQRFTLKHKDVMVPSWYFVLMAKFLPAASGAFVNYMYGKSTEIHGVTTDDIEKWITKGNPTDYQLYVCHRVLADMVILPAVANYYLGDHAGAQSVERFSIACYQRLNVGDCEDLAQVIFMTFESFRKNENLSPALRVLFDSFQPLICTGAASYKSLTAKMTSNDFICHVWTMLIPNDIMNTWLGTNKYKTTPLSRRLYPIMGEGTNFAEPLSQRIGFYIKDNKQQAQREIDRIKASQELYESLVTKFPQLKDKTPIRFNALENDPPSPEKLSTFYRYLISAWPREGGVIHFEKNNKVGVFIHDALRGDRSIKLVQHKSKNILTEDDRRVLLASETQPIPLKPLESFIESSKGILNRDNMVEFRFQSMEEIKGLDLNQFDSYKLIDVRITDDVQVIVLQVS